MTMGQWSRVLVFGVLYCLGGVLGLLEKACS